MLFLLSCTMFWLLLVAQVGGNAFTAVRLAELLSKLVSCQWYYGVCPLVIAHMHCCDGACLVAGTPTSSPSQGKRLSFMGEPVVPEASRAAALNSGPVPANSSPTTNYGGNLEVTVSGTASAVHGSTTTADSEHVDRRLVTLEAAELPAKSVTTTDAEASQSLECAAHLDAASTQSQEGSAVQQQLTDLNTSPRQSLDGSASKRQLTSVHSMQNESAHDSSKKRMIRHSLSGKNAALSAAVPTSSSYSSRYATRQLSGRSSPASTDGAVTPRRSLVASPAASIHGGSLAAVQHPSKPGSGKPASNVRGDDVPGATLAGAAAVLKSHARPSTVDGAGWHLATGDGLPFSPRGSLVASSGGSRTLRPITSQQEALFDAEGNMLPRGEVQAETAQKGVKTKDPAPGSKTVSTGAVIAEAGGLPAKQKIPAKHGMLSMVLSPCFCLRARTTSAEDQYVQGSLRHRFADKEAAAGAQPALVSKRVQAPTLDVKQKQPGGDVASDIVVENWDLGTKVHEADPIDAADVQLSEAKKGAEDGRGLQGAISLAPRRSGLVVVQPDQSPLQELPEVSSWSSSCHHHTVGACSRLVLSMCICQSASVVCCLPGCIMLTPHNTSNLPESGDNPLSMSETTQIAPLCGGVAM